MGNSLCKEQSSPDAAGPSNMFRCLQICPGKTTGKKDHNWNKHIYETRPPLPVRHQPPAANATTSERGVDEAGFKTITLTRPVEYRSNNTDFAPIPPPRKKRPSMLSLKNVGIKNGFKDVFGSDSPRRYSLESIHNSKRYRERAVDVSTPVRNSISCHDVCDDSFADFSRDISPRDETSSSRKILPRVGNKKSDKILGENLSDLSVDNHQVTIKHPEMDTDPIEKFVEENVAEKKSVTADQKEAAHNKSTADESVAMKEKAALLMNILDRYSVEENYENREPVVEELIIPRKKKTGHVCDDDDFHEKHFHSHERKENDKVREEFKEEHLEALIIVPKKPQRDMTIYRKSQENLNLSEAPQIEMKMDTAPVAVAPVRRKKSLKRDELPSPPPRPIKDGIVAAKSQENLLSMSPTKDLELEPLSLELNLSLEKVRTELGLDGEKVTTTPPPSPVVPPRKEHQEKEEKDKKSLTDKEEIKSPESLVIKESLSTTSQSTSPVSEPPSITKSSPPAAVKSVSFVEADNQEKTEKTNDPAKITVLSPEPVHEKVIEASPTATKRSAFNKDDASHRVLEFQMNQEYVIEDVSNGNDGSDQFTPSKLDRRTKKISVSSMPTATSAPSSPSVEGPIEDPIVATNNLALDTVDNKSDPESLSASDTLSNDGSGESQKTIVQCPVVQKKIEDKKDVREMPEKDTLFNQSSILLAEKSVENVLASNLNMTALSNVLNDMYDKTVLDDFQSYLENEATDVYDDIHSDGIMKDIRDISASTSAPLSPVIEPIEIEEPKQAKSPSKPKKKKKKVKKQPVKEKEEDEISIESISDDGFTNLVKTNSKEDITNKTLLAVAENRPRRESICDVDNWFHNHIDDTPSSLNVDQMKDVRMMRRGSDFGIAYDTSKTFPFGRSRQDSESSEFFEAAKFSKSIDNLKGSNSSLNKELYADRSLGSNSSLNKDHSSLLRFVITSPLVGDAASSTSGSKTIEEMKNVRNKQKTKSVSVPHIEIVVDEAEEGELAGKNKE